MHILQTEWIESLGKLRVDLRLHKIPTEIINKAIAQNPWFTPFYIEKNIESILQWWEKETLTPFLQKYPEPLDSPLTIGIIAAGNVPCVGLQDILMVLWSGNIAYVKLSHQDEILIPFLIEKWKKHLPKLENRIFFVPKIEDVDLLIATGSNNTARYIAYHFDYLPKIIRQNRFSVAILRGDEGVEQLQALCYDIFLYNGMGCRNVSHVFSLTKNLNPLKNAVKQYDTGNLSSLYLQKMAYERAKYQLLQEAEVIDCEIIFLKKVQKPQYAPLGFLHVCFFESEAVLQATLQEYQLQIQCVVGNDIALGEAQNPAIDDFADGIDIWKWIIK